MSSLTCQRKFCFSYIFEEQKRIKRTFARPRIARLDFGKLQIVIVTDCCQPQICGKRAESLRYTYCCSGFAARMRRMLKFELLVIKGRKRPQAAYST